MTKSILRITGRKVRFNIPQLLGLILLLNVGVAFFITLFTIVTRYEETAEQFFIDNAYSDMTIHGVFDDEVVGRISGLAGIISAAGRNVRDFREDERIFRAISLTDGINIPFIHEGRLPQTDYEVMLLNRNAGAMGLGVGDMLTLGGRALVITGLASSPEYIYLVQNERNMMAQAGSFGVVFTMRDFFPEGYNEIVVLTDAAVDAGNITEIPGVSRISMRENTPNYNLYREDMGQIRSFAIIFPLVFAALIAVVVYVMLSRTIQKDRKQIGIMKALGISDGKIISIYLIGFCFAALIGASLGGITAIFLCDFIIDILSSLFFVPTLSFAFYPGLWLQAFTVSVMLCAISGMIALSSVLPLLPAHAMRPRKPKSGRRLALERMDFLWKKLSFNTRYALKNSLRNKGRFLAIVLGMCGSSALIVFSLGFHNSITNTQERFFNNFANYDVIISFEPIPISVSHPALNRLNEGSKVLMMPVQIFEQEYTLAVVPHDFDMLSIPTPALKTGIIIPEFFADEWTAGVGDILQISGYNTVISAVIPQYLGLMFITSFDYISEISESIPQVYNTIYGRTEDISALSAYLSANGIDFSTIDDDRSSFDSIMESLSVLILFMIFCSVVLGFTVLYSVGMINLSAREYEYMFMGVMGYPRKQILLAHAKETIVQLFLAIPLGFLLGNILLESIKGEFSGDNFVIQPAVFSQSYLFSALVVIVVTGLMALVTSHHIGRLDIVEGLKAQDE